MTDFQPENYRILAVDDSMTTLKMVENSLREAGFQVMVAPSGEDALQLMEEEGLPHLAVVDINMPLGMDGLELAEKIQQFSDMPVIMLTAVDENDTIVDAIDRLAEDYMTKPFSKGELVARIRRVMRRMGDFAFPLSAYVPVDDDLAVNFAKSIALVQQKEVSLTPTETKLLYVLMRSAGKLIASSYLLRRLWPHDLENASEDRLRVYVHRLRNKIEIDPSNPRYVLAQRGKGYSFGEIE